MKKLLSVLLALTMILSIAGLIACTNDSVPDDNKEDEKTTQTTTTTTARQAYEDPTGDDDDDDDDMPVTEFKVGTIEELVDAMTKINDWDVALNSNITLTADLDFTDSEYSTTENTWYAMEEFRGVFDGAGHTIKGLNYERRVENGVLIIDDTNEFIVRSPFDLACAGYAAFGIIARKLNGGTIKNLTIDSTTVFMNFSYNRNFRTDVGGLVGMAYNATFENITFTGSKVTSSAAININQGHIAGMGLLAGRALGTLAVKNCTSDSETEVDATNCGRFEAGSYIGIYVGDEASVDTTGSTTSAYVSVMAPEDVWDVPTGNKYSPESYRASGNAGAFAGGMIGLITNDDPLTDVDAIFEID